MQAVTSIRSRTVVLPASNIDTDQIIPARFLRTTTREGLGKELFADRRYRADRSLDPDFPLNRPEAQGCRIIVAGRNFGCGSSREHAPWALLDFGIQAVISSEIADIFRSNALKNGLLPVVVDEATAQWLIANPGAAIEIDLASATVSLPTGARVQFPLEAFAKYCLLNGVDELGFLLARSAAIATYESSTAGAGSARAAAAS